MRNGVLDLQVSARGALGLVVAGHQLAAVDNPFLTELMAVEAVLVHGFQGQLHVRRRLSLEQQFYLEEPQIKRLLYRDLLEEQGQQHRRLDLQARSQQQQFLKRLPERVGFGDVVQDRKALSEAAFAYRAQSGEDLDRAGCVGRLRTGQAGDQHACGRLCLYVAGHAAPSRLNVACGA